MIYLIAYKGTHYILNFCNKIITILFNGRFSNHQNRPFQDKNKHLNYCF